MITGSRRAGTPNAHSTRGAAVETSDDRVAAIALFERWQRSPRPHYGDDRPPRIAVSIPILYRQANDAHWHRARVLNLSETGVLFTPARLERGRPVEVILSPPASIGSLAVGKQVCRGEIVRVTHEGAAAARFDECRFLLQAPRRDSASAANPLNPA
jgi:hypothetical protein